MHFILIGKSSKIDCVIIRCLDNLNQLFLSNRTVQRPITSFDPVKAYPQDHILIVICTKST